MKNTVAILFVVVSLMAFAQPPKAKLTKTEYIELYKEDAIREMNESGVPASITLAQGMLESGNGNSWLAQEANNHFGIKCHSDWKGPSVRRDDDKKNECFRKYESVYESFRDHSIFLTTRSRYAFLFELEMTDYKGWAKGLKKAGYATDPKYANLLIRIIEENELHRFDKPLAKDHKKEKRSVLTENGKRPENLPSEITMAHSVQKINRRRSIVARKGDTYYRICKEFDLNEWQLKRYNDFKKDHILQAGERVYVQPKAGKVKNGPEHHIVQEGETMHTISQKYGVKLRKLYKKNNIQKGSEPDAGMKLKLR